MKESLQIEIPSQIEAVVHVGFPDKINSAFYFRNKIRLGGGDDVTYSNLMHDPSIVYHESFHAMIDHLAHLPFEGEGASLKKMAAFIMIRRSSAVSFGNSKKKYPWKKPNWWRSKHSSA